jgi:hypothetical protein
MMHFYSGAMMYFCSGVDTADRTATDEQTDDSGKHSHTVRAASQADPFHDLPMVSQSQG